MQYILYEKILLVIVVILVLTIVLIYFKNKNSNKGQVNEWSYQRYAKFYGNIILKDEYFDDKIATIYDLVVNTGETDLLTIANKSNCTLAECVLKIKYLKNKRKIGDFYIDEINGTINKCSEEDQELLDKYKKYIYYNHYQIDEIATNLPNASLNNKDELKEKVFNDLTYLDSKNLINGILIDEVDKKIIYYTLEKHKNEKDYVTINCPNCGAINDVNKNGKAKCDYCKTIIEDNHNKKRP